MSRGTPTRPLPDILIRLRLMPKTGIGIARAPMERVDVRLPETPCKAWTMRKILLSR